jgi:spermidine synthase
VIAANVIGFFVIPFLSGNSRWLPYERSLPLVVVAAAALGAAFPLIAHATIRADSRSGARLSYLYLSNILGSAAGSFVVGFVLMDYWTLRQIAVALAVAGVAIGGALLAGAFERWKLITAITGCVGLVLILIAIANPLFDRTYEKLYFKSAWKSPNGLSTQRFRDVIETKSGIVTVSEGPGSRVVFGDGSLEARLTTDLRNEIAHNFLVPPYSISGFHPNPRRILMIGLGSGAWAQIIANHPQLEKITIVEINPGYLQLISRYPEVASVLSNPKAEIVIDDARRWLTRNPDKKFDVVVMNTRTYFRDHASTLLSVEFDQLVRRALKPGGVFVYNSTFSPRALLTGATVFPYAIRFRNCLVASDSPIMVDKERWRQVLLSYTLNGQPIFNAESSQDGARLEQVVSLADSLGSTDSWDKLEKGESLRQRLRGWRLVTDDNMGDEWWGDEWY